MKIIMCEKEIRQAILDWIEARVEMNMKHIDIHYPTDDEDMNFVVEILEDE